MKKILIIGIVLIVIAFGLLIYKEFIKPVNIYTVTNSGSKEVGREVYLKATFEAGSLITDNTNGYYVMFGDGVQYIVYMNNKYADKINRYLLDNPEDSYRIEGTTKLIPSDMVEKGRRFVKEWLDKNHNHDEVKEEHSHDIDEEEFYHYFGYVYLDTTNKSYVVNIISYIIMMIGILFVMYFVNSKFHFIDGYDEQRQSA